MKTLQLTILFFLAISILQTQQKSFQEVVTRVEGHLDKMLTRVQSLYDTRCTTIGACATKTYNECSDITPKLECHYEYFKPGQCKYDGGYLNFEHARGRCSNTETCQDPESREIICSQASLFNDEDLQFGPADEMKSIYVGFHNSYRIGYPYFHDNYLDNGDCQEYDPRFRPWYVAAISGAKNIIIAIDKSGSMANGRMGTAREAAQAVVNTLGQDDWFQVLFFSDDSKGTNTVNQKTNLIKASIENKQAANLLIENQIAEGETNYELAFDKIFEIYDQTDANELGSTGEYIVLFLTDGDITQGKTGSALKTHIDTLSATHNPTIFTYGLGDDLTDTSILEEIACDSKGIFTFIADSSINSLTDYMRSYYNYISLGTQFEEKVWSEIYKDAFTDLDFLTCSYPIYVKNNDNQDVLYGVAAIDLLVSELEQLDGYSSTLASVQGRTRANQNSAQINLADCALQSLRGQSYQCPGITCGSDTYGTYAQCDTPTIQDPWQSSGDVLYAAEDLGLCCLEQDKDDPNFIEENTKNAGEIAGIVIGCVVGVILIGTVIGCIIKKKAQVKNEQKRRQDIEDLKNQQEDEQIRRQSQANAQPQHQMQPAQPFNPPPVQQVVIGHGQQQDIPAQPQMHQDPFAQQQQQQMMIPMQPVDDQGNPIGNPMVSQVPNQGYNYPMQSQAGAPQQGDAYQY